MHARNRTWPLGSDPAERCRQRTLPVEGGDGSTLSLDFTTGVLDPRLTFTRLSNATFINSSGLVEWAAANMMTYSQAQDNNSFWNAFGTSVTRTASQTDPFGGTGAVKLDYNATSGDAVISRTVSVDNGVQYTLSVWLRADSGTVTNVRLGRAATAAGATFPTLTTTWQRFSITFTASGTSDGIELRVLTSGSPKTASFHVFGAQLEPGGTARTYQPALAATAYQAPRFDYDPNSIGTPRGLLIEATANNLFNWSETFDTTGGATNWNWSVNVTRGTVSTTNPTGASATVIKIEETTANGVHAPLTVATVLASTTYTFSVWAKAVERTFVQLWENGGSGANSMVNLSTGSVVSESTAGITTVTALGTTGWYRISMRLTTIAGQTTANCQLRLSTNGTTTSYAGTTGSGIYIWGAQLETGSGASSYIPTGASTGSRAADNCVTAIGNLTGFNANQGTIYESWRDNTASDGISVPIPVQEWAFAFGTSGANGCGVFVSNAASGTFGLSGGISNSGDAGPAGTYVIQGVNKAAIAINVATTSLRLSANGSAVSAGTNISGYNGAQTFALGQRNNNTRYLNGWISQFKYWPYVLPDAQLTTLTTL